MSDPVAEKVISTLASVKRIPADKITLETNLQDLGIDSLDVFTLLFELENAFKISIPDDDVRSLRTVNDVVDGIKKLLAAAPPDSSLGSATPADRRMAPRRVAFTGLGIISPLGLNLWDSWKSLKLGLSGIGPIKSVDCSTLRFQNGA